MTAGYDYRTLATAVVAFVVATVLGYWGYGAFQKHAAQRTAVAQVTDAAARLREALTLEAGPPVADRARMVKTLDEYAAAVDKGLREVRRRDGSGNQALADAADDYLLTVREILKKQADTHRHRLQWDGSWQALLRHMRSDDHTGAWIGQAVKARERNNRDFRSYGISAEAFDKVLESFRSSQKKIAPHVGAGAWIGDDLLAKARARARKDFQQAATDMERFRQYAAR